MIKQIPIALEVVLFLASLAVIALTVCVIPLAFRAWRRFGRLAESIEEVRNEVQVLIQESHEMVQSVTVASRQASQQMEDVGKVVRTAQHWTEQADRIVSGVGSVFEPRLVAVIRTLNLSRVGVTAFLRVLSHSEKNDHKQKEKDHV